MKNEQQENTSNRIQPGLVVLIVVAVFLLFTLAYQCLPLIQFNLLVDSFNKIAVGLAALLGVFVGLNWVSRQEEKERKIKEYIKKYPHNKFRQDWEIVEPQSSSGAYYVFEKSSQIVHHILNMKTVYDLGWHVYLNTSNKINDDEFRSFEVGERIRTQGEAGE
ncbi:hypothetical protein A3H85_03270 [Candidatus Daviesbacteria bacterium RIFCSPLOWO2_02_FULL_40_8]|nr:MAG: hypothetical protein A2780_00175 [Candidatus Daviesbacteria bacterium RIFCSPHIGHO2_01_FULL_41_45]OGE34440.1 MAG: hypothetical protein A3C32_03775 [Candidatus Daviesbacteria bacterium RIFCSPHIGHO2_02_FULL_41_14]OGE66787.1 MAG: hypothetical protein A3H85_03270 [Candidatus Daviesbacteria bacterium RIFCSPLOWO2_02_FULL_40_8]